MGCPFSSLRAHRRNGVRVVSRDESRGEHPHLLSSSRSAKLAPLDRSRDVVLRISEKQDVLRQVENCHDKHIGSCAASLHYVSISQEGQECATIPLVQAADHAEQEDACSSLVAHEYDEYSMNTFSNQLFTLGDKIRKLLRRQRVVICKTLAGMVFRALDTGTDILIAGRFIADDKVDLATLSFTFVLVSPIVQTAFVYWKRKRWRLALPFLIPGSIQHLLREWRQVLLVKALPQSAIDKSIHVLAGASYLNEVLAGIECFFESLPQALIQWHACNLDGNFDVDADALSYMSISFSLTNVAVGVAMGLKALYQNPREEKSFLSGRFAAEQLLSNASSAGDTLGLNGQMLDETTCRALATFIEAEDDFITVLDLSFTNCSDYFIGVLVEHAHQISFVNLSGCKDITDEGVKKLAENCKGLTFVELSYCSLITDVGVTKLAENCRGLIEVYLSYCSLITDESLKKLAENCKGLASFGFAGSSVTDEGLKMLARNCKDFFNVGLSGCNRITDEGVKKLAENSKGLRNIFLGNCNLITDESVKKLAENCKGLARVNLSGCSRTTDEGVKMLAENCKELIEIGFSSNLSDDGVRKLAENCKGLTSVGFSDCNLITDESVKKLAESCRGLTKAYLRNCTLLTDNSAKNLAENCKGLSILNLSGCSLITDEGAKKFAEHAKELTEVYLSGCNLITDEGVKKLAENCRGLTIADLSGCSLITNEAVSKLAENCRGMTEVYLRECSLVTEEGVQKLFANCKGLTKVE